MFKLSHLIKKEDKQGFFRNFSVLVVCNLLVNVINLFTNMYLARQLKPELYGQYGVLITWSTLIQTVASLGVQQVAIRAIARNQSNSKYYFKISMIARLIGFISIVPWFVLYFYFHEHYDAIFIVAIVLNAFMLFVWYGFQNVAFGMQRMEATGYINVFGAAVLLLMYIFLPSKMVTVLLVISLLIIIEFLKDIIYYYSCSKEGLFTSSGNQLVSKEAISKMIRESFPFFILIVFALSTNNLPVLFLEHHTNTTEVAYFNTANKLIIPLTMALNTMMSALFPSLTKHAKNAPDKFFSQSQRALWMIVLIGGYVCFCISMFSDHIVLLIYGEDYAETGMVMLTQCWYAVIFALLSLFGTIYAAVGRDKLLATLSIINALVWGPIIWWCSKDGATSMSYGFLIGGGINLISNYFFYLKCLPQKVHIKSTLQIFLILLLGICLSLYLPYVLSLMGKVMAFLAVSLIVLWWANKYFIPVFIKNE